MKVIVPLGVQPAASNLNRVDESDIIEVAFNYKIKVSAEQLCLVASGLCKLLQKMGSTEIKDSVYCINPEGVHVVFGHPVKRIADEEVSDFIAVLTVKINGVHPWCF